MGADGFTGVGGVAIGFAGEGRGAAFGNETIKSGRRLGGNGERGDRPVGEVGQGDFFDDGELA